MNCKHSAFKSFQTGWLLFVTALITSCASIKPEHIRYNEKALLYEYPVSRSQSVFLRLENGELVDSTNYNQFIEELSRQKYRYPFNEFVEKAEMLKEEDVKLAQLYANSADKLNLGKYSQAIATIDSLRKIYPESALYTDAAFLEGYAFEKSGDSIMADLKYSEYTRYSSKKYSDRFRGYKYAKNSDSIWLQQRRYALGCLGVTLSTEKPDTFPEITPKYYFNSLQPGYTLNDETLAENQNGLLFFGFATSSSYLAASIQWYKNITEKLDINPGYFTAPDVKIASLALPVQVYRSTDNRVGIKFSPFIFYSNFSEITIYEITREIDENVFNAGFRISAGYYLLQRLSAGAWYNWNYVNEDRPYVSRDRSLSLWWNNQYDISLYYNIAKGFSFKGGITNGDAVAGIYWNGWEISYNISSPGIISRVDLF